MWLQQKWTKKPIIRRKAKKKRINYKNPIKKDFRKQKRDENDFNSCGENFQRKLQFDYKK